VSDIKEITNFNLQTLEFKGEKYLFYFENSLAQSQQDFISTVSHELRTPLTSIRGFADTMLMAQDKLSKEQATKFLTIIRNQADRLTRLVSSLLTVSTIDKKQSFVLKGIDFNSFIQPVITIFEKKYFNKRYELIIPNNLPQIYADSDILEQIMTNLLDNASKYSNENSIITVKALFSDNKIQIQVIDEGIIIPADKLDKIFDKFSRIDNPLTRKTEGSGLGLFITKSLVEKLGGSIKAENYEKGNIFTLFLKPVSIEQQILSKIKGDNCEC